MARFDVHPTPRGGRGYVVDVQAGLLEDLGTRVVAPLLSERAAPKLIRDLNPVFEIDGKPHVMVTQAIASVPTKELGRPVASLAGHRDEITRALDILLIGF